MTKFNKYFDEKFEKSYLGPSDDDRLLLAGFFPETPFGSLELDRIARALT